MQITRAKGEFSHSIARLRNYESPWIIYPAIIGCATLISDGFITPPISISSAIEGLQLINPEIQTIPIVLAIIVGLFIVQQFATAKIGSAFGPIVIVWFTMMAFFGFIEITKHLEILTALNPVYAFQLIAHYPQGIWLLGAVFLCTTGAEVLYILFIFNRAQVLGYKYHRFRNNLFEGLPNIVAFDSKSLFEIF
jgi:KUP system potassium uptake protein